MNMKKLNIGRNIINSHQKFKNAVKQMAVFEKLDQFTLRVNKSFTWKAVISIILVTGIILSFQTKSEILKILVISVFFLWLAGIIRKVTNWIIIIAAFLLIALTINELSKNVVIIHSFTVPDQFLQKNSGYSGDVIASHLFDEINKIGFEIKDFERENVPEQVQPEKDRYDYSINASGSIPEVNFQQIGFSLSAFYQYIKREGYLKKWFQYQYFTFDGDITWSEKARNWLVTVRLNEEKLRISKTFTWNEETTVRQIAEFLLQYVDLQKMAKFFQTKKDYNRIIDACNEVLNSGKDNVDIRNTLGAAYANTGQMDQAIIEFRKAISLDSLNGKVYYNLGSSYAAKGDDKTAIDYLQKALKHNYRDPSTYITLGAIYARNGDFNSAFQEYSAAVRNHQDYYPAYYQLGFLYLQLNQPDKAITQFETVTVIKPDFAPVYYYLGLLYKSKNEIDKSKDSFNKFLKYWKGDKKMMDKIKNQILKYTSGG
jgi:tetratricopeptide (TPR) repeat protein